MNPGPVGSPLGVWGGGRCTMYRSVRTFYLHYFPRVSTPSVPTCRAARLADRWNTLRRPMEHAPSGSFWRENRVFRSEPRVGGKYSIFPWCCVSVGCVLFGSFFPVFCLRNRHFSPFSAHVFCVPSVPLGTKSLQCFLLGEYLHAYLIMFARESRLVPRLSPFPFALAGFGRAFYG